MAREVMKTLLNERFAPITSSIGYLRLGIDAAAEALAAWRRSIVPGGVAVEEIGDGFPSCLRRLEPLTEGVRPRELLVDTTGGWTAYFDCLLSGTDAISAIGHLSWTVGCQGLAIRATPHTIGAPGVEQGQFGSVQFELFGPLQTEFLNYVRTVAAGFDGSRWVFDANGTEQWFEETDAYHARRVRDRFTSDMLERYCKALDLDVFDPKSYGPRAVMVRSNIEVPPGGLTLSLEEAQQRLGIVPGVADRIPG